MLFEVCTPKTTKMYSYYCVRMNPKIPLEITNIIEEGQLDPVCRGSQIQDGFLSTHYLHIDAIKGNLK